MKEWFSGVFDLLPFCSDLSILVLDYVARPICFFPESGKRVDVGTDTLFFGDTKIEFFSPQTNPSVRSSTKVYRLGKELDLQEVDDWQPTKSVTPFTCTDLPDEWRTTPFSIPHVYFIKQKDPVFFGQDDCYFYFMYDFCLFALDRQEKEVHVSAPFPSLLKVADTKQRLWLPIVCSDMAFVREKKRLLCFATPNTRDILFSK